MTMNKNAIQKENAKEYWKYSYDYNQTFFFYLLIRNINVH